MVTNDEVMKGLKEIYLRADQWKKDGHKGEGPDGHLLRDIRGTCTHYIEELNSTITVAS